MVFSPFLAPEEDGKLFLVVYQHGNSIWAGPPASEARRRPPPPACPTAPPVHSGRDAGACRMLDAAASVRMASADPEADVPLSPAHRTQPSLEREQSCEAPCHGGTDPAPRAAGWPAEVWSRAGWSGGGGGVQGGLIPFEVGVSVVGDVTLAVWVGDHNMGERIHTKPSFAFAFHTGAPPPQAWRRAAHGPALAAAATERMRMV